MPPWLTVEWDNPRRLFQALMFGRKTAPGKDRKFNRR
jgi:hypothetical protein